MLNPANADREAGREGAEDGGWNVDGIFPDRGERYQGPGYTPSVMGAALLKAALSLWHGDATSAWAGLWPPTCPTTVG